MAAYPFDIPALPPLANPSGVNDNPAPPVAQDDLLLQRIDGLQQQITTTQEGFQKQMTTLQECFLQQIHTGFQQMTTMQWQTQQEIQRCQNRSRKHTGELIAMLVRVKDGILPDQQDPPIWFPTDDCAIAIASENQIFNLLEFYGLDLNGTLKEKQRRLKRFLGVMS